MSDYPKTCVICARTFVENCFGDPEFRTVLVYGAVRDVCEQCVDNAAAILLEGGLEAMRHTAIIDQVKWRTRAEHQYERGNIVIDGVTV